MFCWHVLVHCTGVKVCSGEQLCCCSAVRATCCCPLRHVLCKLWGADTHILTSLLLSTPSCTGIDEGPAARNMLCVCR